MDSIIDVKVRGNHLSKDNRNAGVQYEANVTFLRIDFDEGWDGYAKTVTFWDALMGNPTKIVLTTDQLEDILTSTRIYLIPIPGEALTEAGYPTFVIDGYVDGKRKRSLADTLWVKEAPYEEEAGEPTDPTPSQAEQMQVQIDQIIDTIQVAADAKAEALSYAEYAKNQADIATDGANYAQEWGATAYNAAQTATAAQAAAEAAAESAEQNKVDAEACQQAAKASHAAAEEANTSAAASAEAAATSATSAATSEANAKTYSASAYENATIAKTARTAAQTSATSASNSATAADTSAGKAAASAAAAALSAEAAKQVAGGEFATPAEVEARVAKAGDTMTGDLTISKSIAKLLLQATEARFGTLMKNANSNADMGTVLVDESDGTQVRVILRAADQKLVFIKDGVEYELYGKHNLTASGLGAVQKAGDSMTGILTFDTPTLFSALQKKRTIDDQDYLLRLGIGNDGNGASACLRLFSVASDGTETVVSHIEADSTGVYWVAPGGVRKTIAHSGNIGVLTAAVE